VSNFFRGGWDLGTFALAVGLPVAAFFAYLIGASLWDILTHPLEYWTWWLFVALISFPSVVRRLRFGPSRDLEGGYVRAAREIEE
jgi:hypothetical protein